MGIGIRMNGQVFGLGGYCCENRLFARYWGSRVGLGIELGFRGSGTVLCSEWGDLAGYVGVEPVGGWVWYNGCPPSYMRWGSGVGVVARFFGEVSGISGEWLGYLRRADEVWVGTEWGLGVLEGYGLRGVVVPSPIDDMIYCPDGEVMDFGGDWVVGLVTDLHVRKNWQLALRCLWRVFGWDRGLRVVVRYYGIYGSSREGYRLVRDYVCNELGASGLMDRLIFLGGVMGEGRLAAMYRGMDCFLSLSRGEGFDRPAVEARLCGCRVVLSGNTSHVGLGVSDYLVRSWPERVPDYAVSIFPGSRGYDWYEVDEEEVCGALEGVRGLGRASSEWGRVRALYGVGVVGELSLGYLGRFGVG